MVRLRSRDWEQLAKVAADPKIIAEMTGQSLQHVEQKLAMAERRLAPPPPSPQKTGRLMTPLLARGDYQRSGWAARLPAA